MARIVVIGLGSMGMGQARALLAAGHEVHGFDVAEARMDELREEGGGSAGLRDAAARASIVVSAVLNAAQTEAVFFGAEGVADHLPEGAVLISCATIAPDDARRFAGLAADRGLLYLDAPMSGGAVKAAEGKLSIMAAGSQQAFAAARPALDAMAETVHEVSAEIGGGSAMKAVNQLLVGIHIAAMGEALAFAVSQGLDLDKVYRVIGASAGQSWAFGNRAPHVIEGDYSTRSAVAIWPKDLGIVGAIAEQAALPVPLTEAALAQFDAAVEAGDGQADDAAVTRVYARRAKLRLPGES